MNAHDKALTRLPEYMEADPEQQLLAAIEEVKTSIDASTKEAVEIYRATWAYETDDQAAKIVRAVLAKDAAGLLATMILLINGAIARAADNVVMA